MDRKRILRAIDANLNRYKEGLRVNEDIFRFICPNEKLRRQTRRLRHRIDSIIDNAKLRNELIKVRDTSVDPGKNPNRLEMKRKNYFDIAYANFQRAKESIRVLEELFKIFDKSKVKNLKKMRYDIYDAEKEAFRNWSSLCNSR
jgi:thiamine-phosphate pyrophosphorylase